MSKAKEITKQCLFILDEELKNSGNENIYPNIDTEEFLDLYSLMDEFVDVDDHELKNTVTEVLQELSSLGPKELKLSKDLYQFIKNNQIYDL